MGWRTRIADLGVGVIGAGAKAVADWADGSSPFVGDLAKAQAAASENPTDDRGAAETRPPSDKDLEIGDPKSMFWDPFAIIEQLGYKERPTAITYGTLRSIVYRMPVIQSVIQHRVHQVAGFAQPQHDRFGIGFRLRLKDREAKPTAADKKWMADMTDLLMHTGVHDDPRNRDNFETFLRKLTFDSLVYDQSCFEVVPNRMGQPSQWYAVDASTMRIADTATAYLRKKNFQGTVRDDTKYVQIYDGMIISEYTEAEMAFGVRNPRSDMRLYGYGTSELEMLMSTITSLLWAWQYNQKFFSQGSAAKGIINFKGTIPERQLKGFRRHWYNMISGVENAWRTPVTNADQGLEWIKLQENNKDMEFNAWMDFLIKVACSMYSMDPVEINFKYGNTGQKGGSLNEAGNQEKITESKERGLRPILRFLATQINRHIIWPINSDFVFEFVGLDAQTHEDLAKLNSQRVKTTRTVDELRAEEDLPPLPDGLGQVLLDPTWMQAYNQQKGAEMQAEQGGIPGQPGDPAAEGEEGDDDFAAMLEREFGNDDAPTDEETDAKRDDNQRALPPKKSADADKVQKSMIWTPPPITIDLEL